MKEAEKMLVFFDNEKEFMELFGNTSYYRAMQNQISAFIKSVLPSYVIEFGSGSGNTAMRLATENKTLSYVAVDNREELMRFCQNDKTRKSISNLTFISGDLTQLDTFNLINVDVILLVYSFNYIKDPVQTKEQFLRTLHKKMKKGARLVIGDWFLNDTKTFDKENITTLYNARIEEGAHSIFWQELDGDVATKEQKLAQTKLQTYKDTQKELLKHIIKREQLFPVSKKWLLKTVADIGFKVELQQDINNINDAVIVLKK